MVDSQLTRPDPRDDVYYRSVDVCKSGFPHRTRVAIVDDNSVHARALRLQLTLDTDHHFEIEIFDRLETFLHSETMSPDVVFLDRYLPGSGLTEGRIREIRHRHDQCSVILHTGNMTPSLRAHAAQEGAFTVIEKGLADASALCDLTNAAAALRRVV